MNTAFGSKVIVPGTGVVLNDEMDDFSIMPGVPNAFGLVGAENNSIAPGKRPLSSMSPTIVLDPAGKPFMAVGAAGGPKIITQVVLAIVRTIDFEQPLSTAIAGLRFHHQWRPNSVAYEKGMDAKLVEGWRNAGSQAGRGVNGRPHPGDHDRLGGQAHRRERSARARQGGRRLIGTPFR